MTTAADTYLTLSAPSEGLFKDRGSKFIAFAFPVSSEEEIKERQAEVRRMHHGARHHCYAWMLGHEKTHYRANDDGEPSNSAGKPIHGQLQSFDVTNVLIIVVRYFGGVKLGVGGLINAYRTAAAEALKDGDIVERIVMDHYRIGFGYDRMSAVMGLVKDEKLDQFNQQFDLDCKLDIAVRRRDSERIFQLFDEMEGVSIKDLKTQ